MVREQIETAWKRTCSRSKIWPRSSMMAVLPWVLVFLACTPTETETEAEARPVLRVEYAGCTRALAGPICVLPEDRRLTVWVATDTARPGSAIRFELDGEPLPSEVVGETTPIGLGLRKALGPLEGRRLTVSLDEHTPWYLELRSPDASRWWQDVRDLVRSGEIEAAEDRIETAKEAGEASLSWSFSALARLQQQTAEGEVDRQMLASAIEGHAQTGEYLQATNDAELAVLPLLYEQHDLGAARRILRTVPRDWGGPAEASYLLSYLEGHLANLSGDQRTALDHLRAAVDQAGRLGLEPRWRAAAQILASQLGELGRHDEAAEWMERLIAEAPDDLHPCWRGQLLNNLGWTAILAAETAPNGVRKTRGGEDDGIGKGLSSGAVRALEQARQIFGEACSQLPGERLNATLNLAIAKFHGGDWIGARQHLAEVIESDEISGLDMRLWLLDMDGRLAIGEGRHAKALDSFETMALLAEAGLDAEGQWRASLGRARALRALGQRDAALRILTDAERHLDAASAMVPLHEGRERFVETRESAIRLYLDLLLEAERPAEAMAVGRRARSRVLRALRSAHRLTRLGDAEREDWDRSISAYLERRAELDSEAAGDWRLSAERRRHLEKIRDRTREELLRQLDQALSSAGSDERIRAGDPGSDAPAPRPGELTLFYHPLPEGWVGFAADGRGVDGRRLDCSIRRVLEQAEDPEAVLRPLGACLLDPFAAHITRAERIRFLPYGPLRQIDLHALYFDGEKLFGRLPVVYGLDLPRSRTPVPRHRKALLIADAAGDLPAARLEAEAVRTALEAEGWPVEELRGSEALGSSVRQRLPSVSLLHYAGHATFAGYGGWQSALPLAEGSRLTLGDILTLAEAPESVVLSGCETGRTAAESAVESTSLAHAFLVAGSSHVLAATRPVADTTALGVVRAYYGHRAEGRDPADALRRAQLDSLGREPLADAMAFRLVEP